MMSVLKSDRVFKHLPRFIPIAILLVFSVLLAPFETYSQEATPTPQIPLAYSQVAWSPDGTMIAVSGGISGCDTVNLDNFSIRIFDATTFVEVKRLIGHTCSISGLDWSPDSQQIVSYNVRQAEAYIWDVASETLLRTIPMNSQGMSSVVWSPRGDLIGASFPANAVILLDPNDGEIMGRSFGGTAFDWGPNGDRIVTVSGYTNSVAIRDIITREELSSWASPNPENRLVQWSPQSDQIATVGDDENIYVWDAVSGQITLTFNVHNLTDLQWNPDGQTLATSTLDGLIQIWDAQTGTILDSFTNPDQTVSISWNPDGTQLAYFDRTSDSLQVVMPSVTSGE